MARDKRTEQMRISLGDGKPDNIDAACGWMLGILGGGLTGAYVESVLKRAARLNSSGDSAEGGPGDGYGTYGSEGLVDAAV